MVRLSPARALALATLAAAAAFASGCGDDEETRDFTLRFAAVNGNAEVGCGDVLEGFGPDGQTRIELADLRFYVSNLRFFDADGDPVDVTLDRNEFQYVSADGALALIDLTGTATGACAGGSSEGTARTNAVITGTATGGDVARVSFDVGIPQPMMKRVIAENTAEGAPSPLAEMQWSWATAYRYLVMNFVVTDGAGVDGAGNVHIGSNDCGGDGTRALTDRDRCGRVNAPAVSLGPFDLDADVVAVNLRELLEGIDMKVTASGNEVPGCSCHSTTVQADCAGIFANLGITQATGNSSAALDEVFEIK